VTSFRIAALHLDEPIRKAIIARGARAT